MTNIPETINTVTFVTCYLHDKNNSPNNDEWNINRLFELASIGIPLYIFVSEENVDDIACLNGMQNIYIEVISKSDLWVFRELRHREYSLPSNRNMEKDTNDYFAISHSKGELINRAIENNPWKTGHFAYVDFNITYLFSEKTKTYQHFRQMTKRPFLDKMLIFPGCSSSIQIDNVNELLDNIFWRFCGGFFLGDIDTLQTWWKDYKNYFVEYLETYGKLTWDVNFWAWMETIKCWTPKWYSANHNDRIITSISADFITKSLSKTSRYVTHNYPDIEQYRPTSASYLKTPDGRRWLNTRYVNYWLYNNGCYGYPTSSYIIENKNMLCELDKEFKPITDSFRIMNEQVDISPYQGDVISKGLEDIRIYKSAVVDSKSNYNVKFIATTVNYSPNGKNNMVIGDYSLTEKCISNVQVVLPPYNSWCEKNWIPIQFDGEDLFIYKWSPLEIGRINASTGSLEIVMSHIINAPYFNKVRGSTTFMEMEDGLLGVVHFSEDHNPRHYYHMLVLLDKESLRPLKYSNCFCFKKLGVEFCIGFTHELADEYVFWTSHMDRDPMTVFMQKSELPLCFDF
jgi:hypothetical protein